MPADRKDLPESDLVARSKAMHNVLALAQRVAQSDAPVLLTGDSGSGKERVAHYIHAHSRRASAQFVAVNCAALPDQLLESELFGHVRGAFTGAERDKKGFFKAAAGGTLLLDEIGELPLAMQVKLLRVLQDHEVRRVAAPSGTKRSSTRLADAAGSRAGHGDRDAACERGDLAHHRDYLNAYRIPCSVVVATARYARLSDKDR